MMFQNKFHLNNTFIIRRENRIVSMAYTMYFDVKIGDILGKCVYIYGVGTDMDFRGSGLMSQIMNDIYAHYSKTDILFLYLVPANAGLFNMYEKLGYKTAFYLDKKEIEITGSCNLNVSSDDFHSDYIKYIKRFSNVIIRSELDNRLILNECKYLKVNGSGFLFYTDAEKAYIRESYIYNVRDFNDFLLYLGSLGLKKAVMTTYENAEMPYAMIKILSKKISLSDFNKPSYTNLNFD